MSEVTYFGQDDRAKQSYVPYETVKIEIEIEMASEGETGDPNLA